MSPRGFLRTRSTIVTLVGTPALPGQQSPVLLYFHAALKLGRLNEIESIEMVKQALVQKRFKSLKQWISDEKLSFSEALGDMIIKHDVSIAETVYSGANSHHKAIHCKIRKGDLKGILHYMKQLKYDNYVSILNYLVLDNPNAAVDFAILAMAILDVNAALDVFISAGLLREGATFVQEALKHNRVEDAVLQTRFLELCLQNKMTEIADRVLQSKSMTHYDRARVAVLCERSHLYQHALQHYTAIEDLNRVLSNNAQMLPAKCIVSVLRSLPSCYCILLLSSVLGINTALHHNLVTKVAIRLHGVIDEDAAIHMFEEYNKPWGLFTYLHATVHHSTKASVHYKYVEVASQLGKFEELQTFCKQSTVYDREAVHNFLLQTKLSNPTSLAIVSAELGYKSALSDYCSAEVQKTVYTDYMQISGESAKLSSTLDTTGDTSLVENPAKPYNTYPTDYTIATTNVDTTLTERFVPTPTLCHPADTLLYSYSMCSHSKVPGENLQVSHPFWGTNERKQSQALKTATVIRDVSSNNNIIGTYQARPIIYSTTCNETTTSVFTARATIELVIPYIPARTTDERIPKRLYVQYLCDVLLHSAGHPDVHPIQSNAAEDDLEFNTKVQGVFSGPIKVSSASEANSIELTGTCRIHYNNASASADTLPYEYECTFATTTREYTPSYQTIMTNLWHEMLSKQIPTLPGEYTSLS